METVEVAICSSVGHRGMSSKALIKVDFPRLNSPQTIIVVWFDDNFENSSLIVLIAILSMLFAIFLFFLRSQIVTLNVLLLIIVI